MKKGIILTFLLAFACSCYAADFSEASAKTEEVMNNVSTATQTAAINTANSVKTGSDKAAKVIKEQSAIAAEKTSKHVKTGAKKAQKATVREANKFVRFTAKGTKKAAEKVQKSAERTIERTDKNLEE